MFPREELKNSAREFFFYSWSFYCSKNWNRHPQEEQQRLSTAIIYPPNVSVKDPLSLLFLFLSSSNHHRYPTWVTLISEIVLVKKEPSNIERTRDPPAAAADGQPPPAPPRSCPGLCEGRRGRGAPSPLGVTEPGSTPAAVFWMRGWAKCHLGSNASVSRGTGWEEAIRLQFSRRRGMWGESLCKRSVSAVRKRQLSLREGGGARARAWSRTSPAWAWTTPTASLHPLQDYHRYHYYYYYYHYFFFLTYSNQLLRKGSPGVLRHVDGWDDPVSLLPPQAVGALMLAPREQSVTLLLRQFSGHHPPSFWLFRKQDSKTS